MLSELVQPWPMWASLAVVCAAITFYMLDRFGRTQRVAKYANRAQTQLEVETLLKALRVLESLRKMQAVAKGVDAEVRNTLREQIRVRRLSRLAEGYLQDLRREAVIERR